MQQIHLSFKTRIKWGLQYLHEQWNMAHFEAIQYLTNGPPDLVSIDIMTSGSN